MIVELRVISDGLSAPSRGSVATPSFPIYHDNLFEGSSLSPTPIDCSHVSRSASVLTKRSAYDWKSKIITV